MALSDIRIILVEPAHPGNIGAVARAMKTMDLAQLVLVRPKTFPAEDANRRAMGSLDILERARVVEDLQEAIGDCRLVIGGSARPRTFPHEEFDARQCAARLVEEAQTGDPAALVLGTERSGLENRDLDRCTHQVLIPTSAAFSSLNLASAVQILCYEIFLAAREPVPLEARRSAEPPTRQLEMEYFYKHLEGALDSRGFLDGEMREVTMTKLRRLFGRARPNSGELKILHTFTKMMTKRID
jgi:tRNA (cytidine32/uridine32-2'-O)-methyltransferase